LLDLRLLEELRRATPDLWMIAKLPQPKLRQPTDAHTFQCAKLPQPKLRQPTDVQKSQQSTHVRCALVRAYVELLRLL
jgi:hypothetical protein